MSLKRAASLIYPMTVIVVAAALFALQARDSRAGHVRKLEIGPDQPGTVHLAFGRTTAISFAVRPEKVVPGSPQAIEVNFLGKDITVRPLSPKAGNLLVYTKNSRFVLLFQVGSDAQYDDVVQVAPAFSRQPMRLLQDSFHIASFHFETAKESSEVPVSLSSDERSIEGSELLDTLDRYSHLSCTGCVIRKGPNSLKLSCIKPIEEIRCRSAGDKITLRRRPQ